MKVSAVGALILSVGLTVAASGEGSSASPRPSTPALGTQTLQQSLLAPCIWNGGARLNDSQRAGCQIWFFATAGNARFNTYVFQQRLGVFIDWHDVLHTQGRDHRFKRWGLINDPDCRPPNPGEETYGFDWCPGDDKLLAYLEDRSTSYRDPACDFTDATPQPDDLHSLQDRNNPCDLEFGTSSGALGFRKIPNPRFNKEQWVQINNGHAATWEGYRLPEAYKFSKDDERASFVYQQRKANNTLPLNPLLDGSVEPPFLIGTSCGACHIAFDPLHPPQDPAHPAWKNISGTVGNQYARVSQIFASGMPPESLEREVFTRARPGTMDTSGIPNDQVNNAGTINALINLPQRMALARRAEFRHIFTHDILKWRQTVQCPRDADGRLAHERTCWCEPGKPHKCWVKSRTSETVPHILKGGEDSIGALEALQRVYINIGSCAESAWVNHLTDLRRLDPHQRNFGQTPFEIGQARRDCQNFRSIEDRLRDVLNFLMTARPTGLREAREIERHAVDARASYPDAQLAKDLEADLQGNVADGRLVFAKHCATCHSSLPENKEFGRFADRNFLATDHGTGLRLDWLGNDDLTPVTELGTNASRAVHSNHMAGHVWQEYASETYRSRPPADLSVPADGGRGYYRNISLLSLWAHAPFMHDNAIGPELCGGPDDEFYDPPYVDANNKRLPKEQRPDCWPFDPSVEGRYKLFKASVDALLHPEKRMRKITLTREAEHLGPLGIPVTFPLWKPAAAVGNFRHKEFAGDLLIALTTDDPLELFGKLKAKHVERMGDEKGTEAAQRIRMVFGRLKNNPHQLLTLAHQLSDVYSNSMDFEESHENSLGHPFVKSLSEQEKNDLTAFLATL